MLTKGNIIKDDKYDQRGIVLAVTNDGKRARIYLYGRDFEKWMQISWLTVTESGLVTCWKCQGSGVYQGGGMVLNGAFTGYTGECYACQGKGKQDDADRVRCHHYWHRQKEIEAAVEDAEQGREVKPLTTGRDNTRPLRDVVRERKAMRSHSGGAIPAAPPIQREAEVELIDCPNCGTLHRTDIGCPWQG